MNTRSLLAEKSVLKFDYTKLFKKRFDCDLNLVFQMSLIKSSCLAGPPNCMSLEGTSRALENDRNADISKVIECWRNDRQPLTDTMK